LVFALETVRDCSTRLLERWGIGLQKEKPSEETFDNFNIQITCDDTEEDAASSDLHGFHSIPNEVATSRSEEVSVFHEPRFYVTLNGKTNNQIIPRKELDFIEPTRQEKEEDGASKYRVVVTYPSDNKTESSYNVCVKSRDFFN